MVGITLIPEKFPKSFSPEHSSPNSVQNVINKKSLGQKNIEMIIVPYCLMRNIIYFLESGWWLLHSKNYLRFCWESHACQGHSINLRQAQKALCNHHPRNLPNTGDYCPLPPPAFLSCVLTKSFFHVAIQGLAIHIEISLLSASNHH